MLQSLQRYKYIFVLVYWITLHNRMLTYLRLPLYSELPTIYFWKEYQVEKIKRKRHLPSVCPVTLPSFSHLSIPGFLKFRKDNNLRWNLHPKKKDKRKRYYKVFYSHFWASTSSFIFVAIRPKMDDDATLQKWTGYFYILSVFMSWIFETKEKKTKLNGTLHLWAENRRRYCSKQQHYISDKWNVDGEYCLCHKGCNL